MGGGDIDERSDKLSYLVLSTHAGNTANYLRSNAILKAWDDTLSSCLLAATDKEAQLQHGGGRCACVVEVVALQTSCRQREARHPRLSPFRGG